MPDVALLVQKCFRKKKNAEKVKVGHVGRYDDVNLTEGGSYNGEHLTNIPRERCE